MDEMMDTDVKREVQAFYDQVGWQLVGENVYQNAHYEDLREVSWEYIHNCHLRVNRHLKPAGRFLLDAGSGPVQYPEYLTYSEGYRYRVCADISIVALQEARKRIGEHGLFVVCDVANLPFCPDAFDGVVSLHTIHHLPEDQHLQAYGEVHRVLAESGQAVVVNGWPASRFMAFFQPLVRLAERVQRRRGRGSPAPGAPSAAGKKEKSGKRKGTFTNRHDVAWVRGAVGGRMPVAIYPWRSASVRFLRALIHPRLGGRLWLRLLFWLEERFPTWFGENGQYPMIVIAKR
jgi:SAM-dependent methyltransferase